MPEPCLGPHGTAQGGTTGPSAQSLCKLTRPLHNLATSDRHSARANSHRHGTETSSRLRLGRVFHVTELGGNLRGEGIGSLTAMLAVSNGGTEAVTNTRGPASWVWGELLKVNPSSTALGVAENSRYWAKIHHRSVSTAFATGVALAASPGLDTC